jgi:C1A family cysteine protease
MWPYEITLFKNRPPSCAYQFGRRNKSITYFRVPQVLSQLKQCLSDGYLFAFGMVIYNSFEQSNVKLTGLISRPKIGDVPLGGHAVCAVGFDDHKQVFIVRNSWGDLWGNNGYFFIPYTYMIDEDLVYDIWTFRNGPEEVNIDELEVQKKGCCLLT